MTQFKTDLLDAITVLGVVVMLITGLMGCPVNEGTTEPSTDSGPADDGGKGETGATPEAVPPKPETALPADP